MIRICIRWARNAVPSRRYSGASVLRAYDCVEKSAKHCRKRADIRWNMIDKEVAASLCADGILRTKVRIF